MRPGRPQNQLIENLIVRHPDQLIYFALFDRPTWFDSAIADHLNEWDSIGRLFPHFVHY